VSGRSILEITEFLQGRFDRVANVETMTAGGWSRAYAFQSDGRDLVLRVGEHRADFDKELMASAWSSHPLPIPEVLAVGEGLGGSFIVSQKARWNTLGRRIA
jgi:hypothetical protein